MEVKGRQKKVDEDNVAVVQPTESVELNIVASNKCDISVKSPNDTFEGDWDIFDRNVGNRQFSDKKFKFITIPEVSDKYYLIFYE